MKYCNSPLLFELPSVDSESSLVAGNEDDLTFRVIVMAVPGYDV